jgi:SAM-dependent methyltransferase
MIEDYFYPEKAVGGFTHVSSSMDFYTRVNALLLPEMVVVDFGAGRGRPPDVPSERYVRSLLTLKGKVSKFIGVDIDPVVRDNPSLDEAVVILPDAPLPFGDGSIDLVVSDWTFEHIDNIDWITSEMARVLRAGGWLCARTPNAWGYIALGARLIPERLHARVLRRTQPARQECDVFPKYYRLNSPGTIKEKFINSFEPFIYTVNSEPAYFGNSRLLWRLALLGFRLTPSRFGAIIHAFLRRK